MGYDFWFLIAMLVIVIFMMLFSGCGLLPGRSGDKKPPQTASQQLVSVIGKIGWAAPFTALGVAGGVFAIFMGARRIGFAALAASMAATVHVMVSTRYAWLLAILGLFVYVVMTILGLTKNKKMFAGLVRGFESVKDDIVRKASDGGDERTPEYLRALANHSMNLELNDDARKMVAKIKKEESL